MKFWFRSVILFLIPLLCFTADWPVPKSIKCNSSGTFQCKRTGKFENPFDSTCTKYFLCSEFDHEKIEVELKCPENTFYDPINEHCSADYKCICDEDGNSTTAAPTTTSESVTTVPYPDECDICSQCITTVSTKLFTSDSTTWTRPSYETNSEETTLTTASVVNITSSINDTIWTTRIPKTTFSDYTATSSYEESTKSPSNITNSTTEPITLTTEIPKYCSIGGNFTCTKTGRFANPNDPSCKTYFYCYLYSNGEVHQYFYSCSIGLFNPNKDSCDPSYACPCSVESTTKTVTFPTTVEEQDTVEDRSTTKETTLLTSTIISLNDTTWTTRISEITSSKYTATIPNEKSTILPAISTNSTTEPSTGTTDIHKYCSVGGNFTCTKTGRFANPNDPSCKSYFYCYVYSNGEVRQYNYSCSVGFFNPKKDSCDPSYLCPCTEDSTTSSTTTEQQPTQQTYSTNETTVNSESSSISNSTAELGNVTTATSSVTQEPLSTTSQISSSIQTSFAGEITVTTTLIYVATNSTTESSTVSPTTSEYCSVGGNLTCTETGRFGNPNDLSCNSYIYCYVWSDGRVNQDLYSCSVGLFNPNKAACDPSYVCPCSEVSTTKTVVTVATTSPTVTTNDTTESTTILSTTSEYCSLGGSFECTVTGRFANPNDSSCNSYFYCYVWSNDRVSQDLYSCSVGLFNPSKGACDPSYICPCTETSTTKTPVTVTTSSSITSNVTIESTTVSPTTSAYCSIKGNFTCTVTGRFANPNDSSCNSYFYCYVWSNGIISQDLYSCSVGLFNTSSEACDPSYICPCAEVPTTESAVTVTTTSSTLATNTTTPSTTVSSTTPEYCSVGGNFTCNVTGRFANPNDSSCNSYYYCYVWSNGIVAQYLYSCSVGLFNPSKGACDLSYLCPCAVATTDESGVTLTKASSPVTTNAITESNTVSSTISEYCSVGGNFTCTVTGRFANPNDSSCNSYFYCYVWSNGRVGQYLYTCSIGLFNPATGACDTSYICPCSATSTNSIVPSTTTSSLTSADNSKSAASTNFSWHFWPFVSPEKAKKTKVL